MRDHQAKILAGGGLLIAVIIAVIVLANRGYGKVGTKTYEYAMALYSITNRRDRTRLDKLAEMIDESKSEGDVTDKEARWLRQIVEKAREDEWETAASQARRMMDDQIE